ncbi:hypothetical protein EVAR_90579_1 [Eumeta japonica]|uniref:Uncharacterized protein n=1 Tax=Eumeta variegata TaxID=151549 RepID=A0A4C1YU74_EUMVA|nr:hypothetical protein EVAR_90579_1 [Eumeta japonica]
MSTIDISPYDGKQRLHSRSPLLALYHCVIGPLTLTKLSLVTSFSGTISLQHTHPAHIPSTLTRMWHDARTSVNNDRDLRPDRRRAAPGRESFPLIM